MSDSSSLELPSDKLPSTVEPSLAMAVFRDRLDALTDLIQHDLTALSTSLLSKSVISEDVKQEASNYSVTRKARASNLLQVVFNKIKHEPQVFIQFVKILESMASLKVQAEELVLKYQEHCTCDKETTATNTSTDLTSDESEQESSVMFAVASQFRRNLDEIHEKYAHYTFHILKSLKARNESASNLKFYLLNLSAFTSRSDKLLQGGKRNELIKKNTIDEIFIFLSEESTYLNYNIFQSIAKEYGIKEDGISYVEHLKVYLKKQTLSEFAKINQSLEEKCDPSKMDFTFKINIEPTHSAIYVYNLKQCIADILNLSFSPELVKVKEGCVIVTFLVPAHVADVIGQVFTPKQIEKFRELKVMWLESGDTRLLDFTETDMAAIEDVTIVKRNLAKIKGSFATLVTMVVIELTRRNINISEFRLFIITFFSSGDSIFHASNVEEICEAISYHKLWDYSSISPLEEIVKMFANDDLEMKHWISEYKAELAAFKAVTMIAHYIKACNVNEEIADSELARYDNQYYRKLSLRLKECVTEKPLNYIDEFWMSIADYFCLPSLSVLLDTIIKKGYVEVTWFVPTESALWIQTHIQDSEKFLQQMEVISVTMDEEILYGRNNLLLQACKNGQVDEVLGLLKDADVDTSDPEDGATLLIIAVKTEKYELIELLLNHHAQVNKEDKNGYTPLMYSKSIAVTTLLLQHNADVNITTKDGWTALKYACVYHKDLDEIKLLIDKGADVNAWSEGLGCFSWTPLMLAAFGGYLEICQLLLDCGAGEVPKILQKALMVSSSEGCLQVLKLLLKYGANPNAQDSDGVTPLIYASSGGHLEVVKFLLQIKKVQVNVSSNKGWTPLFCACYHNHTEVVAELLSHGADTEIVWSGKTPLIIATIKGYIETVELLLEAKAQVDCMHKSTGWTALMIAASQGNLPIVKLLIKHGSNVSQQSEGSKVTAYDIASIHGRPEVCKELLKRGHQSLAPPTEHMKREVERLYSVLMQSFLDIDNIRMLRYVVDKSQGGMYVDMTKHKKTSIASSSVPQQYPHHTQSVMWT